MAANEAVEYCVFVNVIDHNIYLRILLRYPLTVADITEVGEQFLERAVYLPFPGPVYLY